MTKPKMISRTFKDGSKLFRYDVDLFYNEPNNHGTIWRIELLDFASLNITNYELACLKKILNSKKVTKLLEGF